MTYIVYNYPPDRGNAGDFRQDRREYPTLGEARKDVRERLGNLDECCHWTGYEALGSGLIVVEAYHESSRMGCGGVQISILR
jgi:hypothetical protein